LDRLIQSLIEKLALIVESRDDFSEPRFDHTVNSLVRTLKHLLGDFNDIHVPTTRRPLARLPSVLNNLLPLSEASNKNIAVVDEKACARTIKDEDSLRL
jgi:hypothetical protein